MSMSLMPDVVVHKDGVSRSHTLNLEVSKQTRQQCEFRQDHSLLLQACCQGPPKPSAAVALIPALSCQLPAIELEGAALENCLLA